MPVSTITKNICSIHCEFGRCCLGGGRLSNEGVRRWKVAQCGQRGTPVEGGSGRSSGRKYTAEMPGEEGAAVENSPFLEDVSVQITDERNPPVMGIAGLGASGGREGRTGNRRTIREKGRLQSSSPANSLVTPGKRQWNNARFRTLGDGLAISRTTERVLS